MMSVLLSPVRSVTRWSARAARAIRLTVTLSSGPPLPPLPPLRSSRGPRGRSVGRASSARSSSALLGIRFPFSFPHASFELVHRLQLRSKLDAPKTRREAPASHNHAREDRHDRGEGGGNEGEGEGERHGQQHVDPSLQVLPCTSYM